MSYVCELGLSGLSLVLCKLGPSGLSRVLCKLGLSGLSHVLNVTLVWFESCLM